MLPKYDAELNWHCGKQCAAHDALGFSKNRLGNAIAMAHIPFIETAIISRSKKKSGVVSCHIISIGGWLMEAWALT